MVTKEFLPFSKTLKKPYYYGNKNPYVSAVFTTALFGPAPGALPVHCRQPPGNHQRMSA
jgi:hypothetical protein